MLTFTRQALLIGNDIVDIASPENRSKYSNDRLVRRVLSLSEQKQLSNSQNPELVFLAIWAAKESAYKLLKKRDSELLFAHAKFEVNNADQFIDTGNNTGEVVYALNPHSEIIRLKIEWERTDSWLHCVARSPEAPAPYIQSIEAISPDLIDGGFSEREQSSIYSDQSKAVRNLAKRLLLKHKIKNAEIIRHEEQRRYSPPWIYVNKKRINHLDLSLSHDGKYMAAVLSGESEGQYTQ